MRTDTQTLPVRPVPALSDFAPVAADIAAPSFQHFIQASDAPLMDIARMQADALDDVWDALAQDLNTDLSPRLDRFTPGDLKAMFLTVSARMRILQLQTPMLVPATQTSRMLDAVTAPAHVTAAEMTDSLGDQTSIMMDVKNEFTLLSFMRRMDGQDSLIAVPSAGISGWILKAFENSGQGAALAAMQRCIARVVHDYYHHMRPVNDPVYFSGELMNIEDLPPAIVAAHYQPAARMQKAWANALSFAAEESEGTIKKIGDFEPHALLTHRRVFARMWQNAHVRDTMKADIDAFLDGTAKVSFSGRYGDYVQFAALTILGTYLLRAAGAGHEMLDHFRDGIAQRFSFTHAQTVALVHAYNADSGLAAAENSGERVMWNALRIANVGYGAIHARPISKLSRPSRRLAQHEMNRARAGMPAWP